jgi:surfeit locus 1 family protein
VKEKVENVHILQGASMALNMQFSFRQQRYNLRFSVGFLSLCLFFVALFCVLGEWQLYRYHFKQTLVSTYAARSTATPKPLAELLATNKNDLQFQRVAVQGQYLNQQTMFVQNRFYKEQLGYEVITPLQIPGQSTLLLVDRGWVQKPADAELPNIATVTDAQQIIGNIKLVNEYQFILGQNILQPKSTPLVMQKVDVKEISQLTQQTYYPFVLRLDPVAKNGFVRDWALTGMNPERHMGYAVQWFLMAIVLFIAYFSFCFERIGRKEHANS